VDDCALIATEIVAAAAATCIRFAHQDALSAESSHLGAVLLAAFRTMARGEVLRLGLQKSAWSTTMRTWRHNRGERLFHAVTGQVGAWFDACGSRVALRNARGRSSCMPLSEWKHFFGTTLHQPFDHDLFDGRELFDLRALSGDPFLSRRVNRPDQPRLEQTDILVPLLANDTLGHLPPLTVFRGLGCRRRRIPNAGHWISPSLS